jgi:hypothetical protein
MSKRAGTAFVNSLFKVQPGQFYNGFSLKMINCCEVSTIIIDIWHQEIDIFLFGCYFRSKFKVIHKHTSTSEYQDSTLVQDHQRETLINNRGLYEQKLQMQP